MIAGFMEVSGLDGENAVIEYREGNDQTGDSAAPSCASSPASSATRT